MIESKSKEGKFLFFRVDERDMRASEGAESKSAERNREVNRNQNIKRNRELKRNKIHVRDHEQFFFFFLSRFTHRRSMTGVPTRCWCGMKLRTYVSQTDENPC
ncbi:unnamed protein product [Thlaspi arvense]|uniref:Uncharacterized protein n=1 Tax=Thlaspi arvense TaxID=13288 RepID=A0AAU9SPP2_THLAR|nr:unnamed protein product [Thlaspi arvense]